MNTKEQLKQLYLSEAAKEYEAIAIRCEQEGKSHLNFLDELLYCEIEHRYQKRIDRLLKQAKLPRRKTLESFEYKRIPGLSISQINQLATGDFIDHCDNILIFGNPGTGKTHLSIALAQQWCLQGRHVYYETCCTINSKITSSKSRFKIESIDQKIRTI